VRRTHDAFPHPARPIPGRGTPTLDDAPGNHAIADGVDGLAHVLAALLDVGSQFF
jgi:hypothetical protein